MEKMEKLYLQIDKLCAKNKISCQKDIAYNGDLHLQFRRPKSYGIDYAECYVSTYELQRRGTRHIIRNLKGFINLSFNLDFWS